MFQIPLNVAETKINLITVTEENSWLTKKKIPVYVFSIIAKMEEI